MLFTSVCHQTRGRFLHFSPFHLRVPRRLRLKHSFYSMNRFISAIPSSVPVSLSPALRNETEEEFAFQCEVHHRRRWSSGVRWNARAHSWSGDCSRSRLTTATSREGVQALHREQSASIAWEARLLERVTGEGGRGREAIPRIKVPTCRRDE
jgi:hypothetical protein